MSICKHRHALFIARETASGIVSYRKQAYVCPNCGEFIVWIDGKKMTFKLVSDEQVAAAGRYAATLREAANAE